MVCCNLNEYIVAFFNAMFFEWELAIMTSLPIEYGNAKKQLKI
jgi:hypothetical protein